MIGTSSAAVRQIGATITELDFWRRRVYVRREDGRTASLPIREIERATVTEGCDRYRDPDTGEGMYAWMASVYRLADAQSRAGETGPHTVCLPITRYFVLDPSRGEA